MSRCHTTVTIGIWTLARARFLDIHVGYQNWYRFGIPGTGFIQRWETTERLEFQIRYKVHTKQYLLLVAFHIGRIYQFCCLHCKSPFGKVCHISLSLPPTYLEKFGYVVQGVESYFNPCCVVWPLSQHTPKTWLAKKVSMDTTLARRFKISVCLDQSLNNRWLL